MIGGHIDEEEPKLDFGCKTYLFEAKSRPATVEGLGYGLY